MPRKPKRTAGPVPMAPTIPFGSPFGWPMPIFQVQAPQTEKRTITRTDLKSSEVELDDGSLITLIPEINDVKKAIGQVDASGNPVYIVTLKWDMKVVPGNTEAPRKRSRSKTGKS